MYAPIKYKLINQINEYPLLAVPGSAMGIMQQTLKKRTILISNIRTASLLISWLIYLKTEISYTTLYILK